MKFSEISKELRKEKNISQQALARNLGISKACISMIEIGKNEPTASTLIAYANFFNTTLDFLVGRGREDDFGVKIYENSGQITDRLESDDIEKEAIAILRRYPPEYKKHALVALENDLDTIIEVKKSLRTNF